MSLTARSNVTDTLDPEIRQLFPEADSLDWVRTWCGQVDELHPVSLRMGYDGTYCRGIVRYGSIGPQLLWKGLINGGELRAYEIDSTDSPCGIIMGSFSDSTLALDWYNMDRTTGYRISLAPCDYPFAPAVVKETNLWLRYYTGMIGNTAVTLLWQKNASDRLRGVFYFPLADTSWTAAGKTMPDNRILLRQSDLNNIPADSIFIDSLTQKDLRIHWADSTGMMINGRMKLKDTYEMTTYLYMDYFSNFAFLYPRLKSPSFNNWFGQFISDWLRDCTKQAANFREIHPAQVPELRASVRAYGWCDHELITRYIASGQAHYTSTWSAGEYSRAFNFDLKKGREIKLEDIFKPDFNYKTYIDDFIRRHFTGHPMYDDPDFRAWIDQEDFRIFMIRRDGITFSTKFNIIYGKVSVTIPYPELENHIAKTSVVRSVMQQSYGIVLPKFRWPEWISWPRKKG